METPVKLLFLTQWIDRDDGVLGFVPRWVEGLAGLCERVRVVALWSGDTSGLPANVDVRTVGRTGRIGRYLRYRRVLKEALEDDGFDTVLAHMVPRYALLAAGPARRAGVPVYLWYTTKGVDARLHRSERVVERIFTASAESLRIETAKRVETGHGIDLKHFTPGDGRPARPPRILSVGRLTPAKDPLTILAAQSILVSRGYDLHLDLVGPELAAGDAAYRRTVEDQIELGGLADRVALHGSVPYPQIPEHYRQATAVVNASHTGSVDKVVLEAMACGRPVVTCNESFRPIFAELGAAGEELRFEPGNADQLADRLEALFRLPRGRSEDLGRRLRALVERDHDVDRLMERLVSEMGAGRREGGA